MFEDRDRLFPGDCRIVVEKFVKRVSRLEILDEGPDGDPGSGKNGCAGEYVGIAD